MRTMIRPLRIGHAVLGVRNIERSTKFYTEVLGFQISKTYPEVGLVFLRTGDHDHHEVALSAFGEDAPGPIKKGVGLVHLAFRLKDWAHLQAAYKELKERGVTITGTVNHNITRSLYFLDPDGNQLEVYCDNPAWRDALPYNSAAFLDIEGAEPDPVPEELKKKRAAEAAAAQPAAK